MPPGLTSVSLWEPRHASPPTRTFLAGNAPPTPFLVLDLDVVRRSYQRLREVFRTADIYYAVKANPARDVITLLANLGARFDVASVGEIDLCLELGVRPEAISFGNTIKKASDIAHAYARGVRLFAFDSETDLTNLANHAPGSSVFCRLLVENEAARFAFGNKFGCAPDMAVDLLRDARSLGLDPCGVSFHVGSQQPSPAPWEHGIAAASAVAAELARDGIALRLLNLGGGFPVDYAHPAPELAEFGAAIDGSLRQHFGAARPAIAIEPGRYVVAGAGLLRTEVVSVSRRSYRDETRWVYLDVGRFGGLPETEAETIEYRLVTARDGEPSGPVVVAGPTCDGDDVLYRSAGYRLPLTLRAGDYVDIMDAGAYTANCASVSFNGFAPPPVYCVGDPN